MSKQFKMDGYVEAKDRVAEFWRLFPDGRIRCLPPKVVQVEGRTFIESHVLVYTHRDHTEPDATGTAWEQWPGKTPYTKDSEAMNAETSAVGRALGFLSIGITGSLASADEVRNRRAEQEPPGASVAKVKAQLVERVTAAGVSADDAPKHAKAIWDNAEVKVVDGRVEPLELDVLDDTARTYLDDLAAVNA